MLTEAEWNRHFQIMQDPRSPREAVLAACDALEAHKAAEIAALPSGSPVYNYKAQRWTVTQ